LKTAQMVEKIARLIWEKKGQDIVILDLRHLTDISDYFVVANGDSDTHVKALADYVEEELKKDGIRVWHKEGHQNLSWVLLDYIEVVVHIFRPPTREYFALEKLWGDARIIRLEEDVPDRILLEAEN
jgi:ribosome-associated protein